MDTELLYKYFKGEATEQEENRIVEWVESSAANKAQFLKERMCFDAILFAGDAAHAQKDKKKRFYIYPIIAVAAMCIALFFIGLPGDHTPEQLLSQSIHIPAGQRAQMDLPDGTVVWLNSQTTLTYDADFGKKDRKVTLDGEAYFDVAHNAEKPFRVQTENINIQVTGTKFDVCSYSNSQFFIARLIEGSINLFANNAEEQPLGSLTKGKYFSAKNGKYKTGELQSNNALAWMEGIYYFDDVPFKELLEKIALYYNYKITVMNPKILDGYRCTGKFKDLDGIEHILKVIQKDHPFRYTIDNEHNKITIE